MPKENEPKEKAPAQPPANAGTLRCSSNGGAVELASFYFAQTVLALFRHCSVLLGVFKGEVWGVAGKMAETSRMLSTQSQTSPSVLTSSGGFERIGRGLSEAKKRTLFLASSAAPFKIEQRSGAEGQHSGVCFFGYFLLHKQRK